MIRSANHPLRPGAFLAAAMLFFALTAGAARAGSSIAWLGDNFPLDLSADGRAAAGNTGAGIYSAFRWTPDTGVVDLGMSSSLVFGSGAGTPDISDDGQRVSATVITPDSTAITQGIWTKGIGWQVSMPPVPADGGMLDDSYGSCWGLSGDGQTLTGFYWRPGASDGTAHANTWSLDGTFTALSRPVRNFRGNDLSYDGSVVVGWSERFDGVWCPTVWEGGGFTVLHDEGIFCEAEGVSGDGNVIWGAALDTLTNVKSAALWIRNGTGWDEQVLGALPGTFPGAGAAICQDRSADGSLIVGYNTFDGSPYNNTGFVWTLAEGIVSAADFLASRSVTLPPFFVIDSLTAVSDNGNIIAGFGHYTNAFPFVNEGFIITLDDTVPVPDIAAMPGLDLAPPFPNPFNPSTLIALEVPTARSLDLTIVDARGRLVRRLHAGHLDAGRHEFRWDGRDATGRGAASGVYYSVATDEAGATASTSMTLLK